MRILVVEDDRKVASFIRKGLEEEGHAVEVAADGDVAVERAADGSAWDLVVLDVMLPKRDGFSVLKALRADGLKAPVLMLTARDAVGDRVTGLDLGADDYLTKPFAFDEFLARVRALLRRGQGRRAPVLRLADLALDPATREETMKTAAALIAGTLTAVALVGPGLAQTGSTTTAPAAKPAATETPKPAAVEAPKPAAPEAAKPAATEPAKPATAATKPAPADAGKPAATETPKPTGAPVAKSKRIAGEVVSVNVEQKTLVVKATVAGKATEMTFGAEKTTGAALADLRPGEHVRVTYTDGEGRRMATAITRTQEAAKTVETKSQEAKTPEAKPKK